LHQVCRRPKVLLLLLEWWLHNQPLQVLIQC
jgi:hypothetical protein